MLTVNPILQTDSYKFSHAWQYPPGTRRVSAYIEARPGGRFDEVVFFGLQIFLHDLAARPVTAADIDEAEAVVTAHGLPFNREGWEIVVSEHGGRLPLVIQALPEGTVVPVGTPLVQIINSDPRLPWLTTYIETRLLRAVWYPSTVATISRRAKSILYDGLVRTSDNPDAEIRFKLHDFGGRGATCGEAAGIGGAAHLVNFMGTDTVEGIVYARRYYDMAEMPAFSVPAAEHSTITSWGPAGEVDAYRNMLRRFGGPGKIVSVVSDSYDLDRAVADIWGGTLRQEVLDSGARLVVRPDSGDPVETPIRVMETLWQRFGGAVNGKGYRVLSPSVRVLQGDGMDLDKIARLTEAMAEAGLSLDNIVVGMGGGLLQKLDRDTLRFAMKANAIDTDGTLRDVYKQPATDPTKASKAGRVAVVADGHGGYAVRREDGLDGEPNLLEEVFVDGRITRSQTFPEVRAAAWG